VDLILDDDRLLDPGRQLRMEIGGNSRTVKIEFFRRQNGRFVMKFAGIDSIEDAEKIVGAELLIPESEIPEAEEGSFYTFHLRGCRVYAIHEAAGSADGNRDEYIGDVTDIVDGGGTQLLQVGTGKEETLIPFAESIVKKVDLAGRRIEVDLPKGLRELNK